MTKCVVCGSKAKEKRLGLDYCKVCGINFDNRLKTIINADDKESLESNYTRAIKTINEKDSYNDNQIKEMVIRYFKNMYDEKIEELTESQQIREDSGIVYQIQGNRGRCLEVYSNKVVIYVNITMGSILTGNATDGKKTIYYKDVIGLQFKPSGTLIGYLQLETASMMMNNENSNYYNENTFTFDETTTSNRIMYKVERYIDQRLSEIKGNNNISIADEIRKFKSLLDDHIITQEEFDQQKRRLLAL